MTFLPHIIPVFGVATGMLELVKGNWIGDGFSWFIYVFAVIWGIFKLFLAILV